MKRIWEKGRGIIIAFGFLLLVRFILPLPFIIEVIIFGIYTLGLNFLLGRAGFISFGQPAYLGIGAYGTAIYLFYFGTNPYAGIILGVIFAFIISFILGPFFVRLRGDYFALVNLAFAVIVYFLVLKVFVNITHGNNGLWYIMRIKSTRLLDLGSTRDFFVFIYLLALGLWIIFRYIDFSIYGAGCLASKINEEKMRFLGYNTFNLKWSAFVLANTITGLAGSLYAIYFGFVGPNLIEPTRAAEVIVVALLGGIGTLFGPLVGSFVYTGMKDLISKVITHWELVIGLLLVIVMLAGEKGIWGTLEPILNKALFKNKEK